MVNDVVFLGAWITACVSGLLLSAHAATNFPRDDKVKYAIRSAKDLKGAVPFWYELCRPLISVPSHVFLSLIFLSVLSLLFSNVRNEHRAVVCGIFAVPAYGLKAISMSRFSDPAKPAATVFFACTMAAFLGPLCWSFFFYLVSPFLLTTPQLTKFEVTVKRVFTGFAVLCGGIMFSVILLQLLDVEGEGRRALSTAFFVSLGVVASLCVFVLSVGGWKVRVMFRLGGGGIMLFINCPITPSSIFSLLHQAAAAHQ
jgi:hypothetical protein